MRGKRTLAAMLGAVALILSLLIASGPVASASTAAMSDPALTLANGKGITVDSSRWVDPRLLDLQVSSTVLASPAGVRIVLPADYQANPTLHYPVLYLLHGGYGSYLDWTTAGHAEQLTARLPLIVVMPDAGKGGWYSDWENSGSGGPPEWETFHIDQLIPWVDSNFRTIAHRRGRAIAGVSMGGFGALSYAARHHSLFAAAASFSGAVDTNDPGLRYLVYLSPLVDGGPPGAIYGSSLFDGTVAEAHNPYNLANELRGMHVALYTGDGFPGPLDPPGASGYDYNEFAVHEMSVALDLRLDRLGIPHTFDDYGNGTHSWPYWNRDLQQELPAIMNALARPTSKGDVPATAPTAPTATTAPTTTATTATNTTTATTATSAPIVPAGAVLHVALTGANNGACSQAAPCRTVSHAEKVAAPGDTISIGPGTFTDNVTIDKDVTVDGSPAGTILTGRHRSTSPTIAITSGAHGRLDGLTVQNANPLGDGVDDSGTVTIDDATLSGNGNAGLDVRSGSATVNGTTISNNGTYGVANEGVVTINDSTISANDYGMANDASGTITGTTVSSNDSSGVVTLRGTTAVDDSTVSGNHGEGVQAFSGTTVVDDSTLADNGFYGAASSPSPYAPDAVITLIASTISGNSPNGIAAVTPVTVAATIVAGNTDGDCSASVADAGYNLAGDQTCGFSAKGSKSSVDPELGPLQDNGGPTKTEAPGSASRAVDAIPRRAIADIGDLQVALCKGTTDQRGVSRPQPGPRNRCDVGSVELAPSSAISSMPPSTAVAAWGSAVPFVPATLMPFTS